MSIKKTLLSIFFLLAFSLTVNNAFAIAPDTGGGPTDPPAGTISSSSSNCIIQVDSDTCNVTLQWSVSNAVGTTKINGQSVGKTSGTDVLPVSYPSTTFTLVNSGDNLDSVTVTASCDPSAPWNGSYCALPPAPVDFNFDMPVNPNMPTGSITVPSCTISSGQGTCATTISWDAQSVGRARIYLPGKDPISNGSNGNNENQYIPGTVIGSSTGPNASGSGVAYALSLGSTTFNLFDVRAVSGGPDGETAQIATTTATATCAPGTVWDSKASLCIGPSGNLKANPTSCEIKTNESSCKTDLIWDTTNPIGAVTITRNGSATVLFTAANCASCSTDVPYGNQTYVLNNNSAQLSKAFVFADCSSKDVWDIGSKKCVAKSSTGNISANWCTISLNGSNCPSSVQWSSSGATSPNVTEDGKVFSTLASSTVDRVVGYGPHTFNINDGSIVLKSAPIQAYCDTNLMWDSSLKKCVKANTTISANDCAIPTGQGTCKSLVSWTSNNPPNLSIQQDGVEFSKAASSAPGFTTDMTFGKHNFAIVSSGALINQTTAKATCESPDASWFADEAKCLEPTGGTINASDGCTIKVNESTCPIQVAWETNLSSVEVVDIYNNVEEIFSTAPTTYDSSSGTEYPVTRNIKFGRHDYKVRDTSKSPAEFIDDGDDSTAVCEFGSAWDGNKCIAPGGTLVAYDINTGAVTDHCTIPKGGTNCNVKLKWTTANPIGTSQIITYGIAGKTITNPDGTTYLNQDINPYDNSTGHAPIGNDGTQDMPVVYANGLGTHETKSIYALYNNQQELQIGIDSNGKPITNLTIFALCDSGSGWDGNKCVNPNATLTTTAVDGNGTPNGCDIAPGQSVCSIPFEWNVEFPPYGSNNVVTRNEPIFNTIISGPAPYSGSGTANVQVYSPVNSTTLYLYNDSILAPLKTLTVHAICPPSAPWDGFSCKAPSPNITFNVNPLSVPYRGDVNITWTAQPATSCSSSDDTKFSTLGESRINGKVSGSTKVNPRFTTTYSLSCENYGSVTVAPSKTVTVGKVKTTYNEN